MINDQQKDAVETSTGYVPTPAEIAAACLQIQSEWTPEERNRRLRCDLREPELNQTALQPVSVTRTEKS